MEPRATLMPRAADLVESSAIARVATAMAARVAAYARTSRLSRVLAPAASSWASLPHRERTFSAGLVLVCAVVTHVALRLAQGAPGDWLWLIVPGIAAAQGVVLVAASKPGPAVDE